MEGLGSTTSFRDFIKLIVVFAESSSETTSVSGKVRCLGISGIDVEVGKAVTSRMRVSTSQLEGTIEGGRSVVERPRKDIEGKEEEVKRRGRDVDGVAISKVAPGYYVGIESNQKKSTYR